MDSEQCFACSKGCKYCKNDVICQQCLDDFILFDSECQFTKTQVYIILAIFFSIIIVLFVVCIRMMIATNRQNKVATGSFLASTTSRNKQQSKAFKSFTVLDDESRHDNTKISDVETIGKTGRFHLSFIESKSDGAGSGRSFVD